MKLTGLGLKQGANQKTFRKPQKTSYKSELYKAAMFSLLFLLFPSPVNPSLLPVCVDQLCRKEKKKKIQPTIVQNSRQVVTRREADRLADHANKIFVSLLLRTCFSVAFFRSWECVLHLYL